MRNVRHQVKCTDEIHRRFTGKNISVAVLDTGIFLHPDFDSRVILFRDFIHHKKAPYDDSGHGTHVAGCLAGSGLLSNGDYRGIAPKCNLIIGKVLDENGEGRIEDVIQALQWIIRIRKQYNIRVLNLSVSFRESTAPDKVRRLNDLLNEVNHHNIVIFVAAGNHGPRVRSISPLGLGNHVICVGCCDPDRRDRREHLCEDYSGRGPGIFEIKKPDLVAPGTKIYSVSKRIGERNKQEKQSYEARSGTSFSTPIAAGAAVLIAEKYPKLNREEIKRRLLYNARDLNEPWNKQGWGMLDVMKALE